jgi:hypothetical protein
MMGESLSIESSALAIPEPDGGGVRVYKGIPYAGAADRRVALAPA